MTENTEIIICAAIKIIDSDKIFYGHRHNHCIQAMTDNLSWHMNREEISKLKTIQGFITSNNRFVDRKEALKIAMDNNQLTNFHGIDSDKLYSENLY